MMRGVDIRVPCYNQLTLFSVGGTVRMPREIVPMILNAWMPPMMTTIGSAICTVMSCVDQSVGCVSEHGPPKYSQNIPGLAGI